MRLIVAVALFILAAGPAAAQPAPASPEPVLAQPTQTQGEELSETTALWLGIGGTAASWSLLVVGAERKQGALAAAGGFGTFLLPGSGHMYAGSFDGRGSGLRLVAIGFYAAAVVLSTKCDDGPCGALAVPLSLAAGFYVWGTIDSIATAPAAVRHHNEQIKNLAIVPVIQPDRSGVMLVGEF